MAQFFTYCWQHRQVLLGSTGDPVGTAYGSQFSRRGIRPGDDVYIVSVHRGRVHLLGKMRVGTVLRSVDEYRRLTGEEPTRADEYLIADACTPGREQELSRELTRDLRFLRGKHLVGLTIGEEGRVDRQSLRSVRRLNAESAAALDALLPPVEPFRPGVRTTS
jgi:hypothetical protein